MPIPELLPTAAAQVQWNQLYRDLDAFADDWLSLALGILEGLPATYALPNRDEPRIVKHSLIWLAIVGAPACCRTVNVMVSSNHLLPMIAKTILFRLSRHIAIDHMYSSYPFGMPVVACGAFTASLAAVS